MSEMKHAPLWYPPQFPVQGRLPRRDVQVEQNIERQRQQEYDYHDALCMAAGRRVMPPCCKTLHISLCFDGTGNNLNNDFYLSNPRHPTNIARLFRASIGDGYAGGTSHSSEAQRLTDAPGTGNGQYFKYYMPGVGTPFPEVGDLDYGTPGLALASYGEERINWGLMMIIDALRRTLGQPRLDNTAQLAAVKAMGTVPGFEWGTGHANRSREFRKQLEAIAKPLHIALTQRQLGQVRLLGIKLYVYGFSRGAAAARAFVSWLNGLLSWPESALCLTLLDIELPISVEYLGLLDTVASVGIADIAPGADGHMSWADGNQELPTSSLVKRCLHIVASHEQRLCFPLDSIRRENGDYPANSVEVIHPGVHSDQGGGYPPGDQGKAVSPDSRIGDSLLLSQIALNDLYADAFSHGAPLKVPKEALPIELRDQMWRAMEDDVEVGFGVAPTLVDRFNAWRQVTLGLIPTSQPLPVERAEHYQPLQASDSLEQTLREQMAWLTAWRIDRYAFASLKQAPFYLQASDTQADKAVRGAAETKVKENQAQIVAHRKAQLASERYSREPKRPMKPGVKDFDPDMAQTQLREAAEEFGLDYRSDLQATVAIQVGRRTLIAGLIIARLTAERRAERPRMKAAGQAKVRQMFPRPAHEYDYEDEHRRGNVDESRNAEQPEGLLRALFDDQVHDSRAWFLYAAHLAKLGTGMREPLGSYLSERMVFFGNTHSRALALYGENDQPIVAGDSRLQGIEQPGTAQPPVMTPERLAQAHKNIDALWEAHYAKASGVNDAPV